MFKTPYNSAKLRLYIILGRHCSSISRSGVLVQTFSSCLAEYSWNITRLHPALLPRWSYFRCPSNAPFTLAVLKAPWCLAHSDTLADFTASDRKPHNENEPADDMFLIRMWSLTAKTQSLNCILTIREGDAYTVDYELRDEACTLQKQLFAEMG